MVSAVDFWSLELHSNGCAVLCRSAASADCSLPRPRLLTTEVEGGETYTLVTTLRRRITFHLGEGCHTLTLSIERGESDKEGQTSDTHTHHFEGYVTM
jgi:hypothetical protein